MTRDELQYARVAWLTSAVRGLLKARAQQLSSKYQDSSAGEADAELSKEEAKYESQNFGPLLVQFLKKKAQQVLEDWMAK